MKNSAMTGSRVLYMVLALVLCGPVPALACGGGGGNGGEPSGIDQDYTFTKPSISPTRRSDSEVRKREIREQEERLRAVIAQQHIKEGLLGKAESICVVADWLGWGAQIGLSIATAGTSTWAMTSAKILMSGARGTAEGRAYAMKKGENEAVQAAKSGGVATAVEVGLAPFNPLVGVVGSEVVSKVYHADPVKNKASGPSYYNPSIGKDGQWRPGGGTQSQTGMSHGLTFGK